MFSLSSKVKRQEYLDSNAEDTPPIYHALPCKK